MELKIKDSMNTLEDILQEIKILLKMSDTNLFSFNSYKLGKTDKPPYLSPWAEETLVMELEKIIGVIEQLDEVKKELKLVIKDKNV